VVFPDLSRPSMTMNAPRGIIVCGSGGFCTITIANPCRDSVPIAYCVNPAAAAPLGLSDSKVYHHVSSPSPSPLTSGGYE